MKNNKNTKTGEIMSKELITVSMGTPVYDASKLLEEKRIRHLPVTDEEGDIVGVFSKRDFTVFETLSGLNVEHLMSSPVEYITEDTPIRNAVFKMLEKKISSLIITSEKDEDLVVGIITTDDLLWHLAHLLKEDESAIDQIFSADHLQTVGKVAEQIGLAGI